MADFIDKIEKGVAQPDGKAVVVPSTDRIKGKKDNDEPAEARAFYPQFEKYLTAAEAAELIAARETTGK